MSRFISLFRYVALIIAASLLGGCSAVKLAYNQAPDLSYWWLDAYFDFNEQQSPKVRDELAKLFAWHRASELPKTADFLAQTAQQMTGEISAQQACKAFSDVRALIDNITQQALPAMAEIAPSFTAAQMAHLQRKHAKNNDEYSRDFIRATAQERQAKRHKTAVDRSEMLYGKLEEPQLAAISQALASSGFDAAVSLKERQRRQQEQVALLGQLAASKASAHIAQQSLRAYIQRSWESPDPVYRAYAQRLTQDSCASFASVHASTNAAQRANAARVLKGYEADLRALAAAR